MIEITKSLIELIKETTNQESVTTFSARTTVEPNQGGVTRISGQNENFFQRYIQQSKIISQIIAYVWRYIYDTTDTNQEHRDRAQQLDNLFRNQPTFLFARPNSDEVNQMKGVFLDRGNLLTRNGELFNDQERTFLSIKLDVTNFRTQLRDPAFGEKKWTAVLAYPPRPYIHQDTSTNGGQTITKGQLTNQELEDWVNNTEDNKFVADNPFIPLCCS